MIPHSSIQCQSENATVRELKANSWQRELSNARITAESLCRQLALTQQQQKQFLLDHQIPANFPLRATQSYIARIREGDPEDPLLRQILPRTQELIEQPGFVDDPLDEDNANPVPGIVRKYNKRALFIVTQACAIHCRYCFRRHFPYQDNIGIQHWQQALDYLRQDTTLNEVILSGGDPLSANDQQLMRLIEQLAEIKHISRLRIHSRLPVVLPSRINSRMLEWLARWPGQKIMVIHSNHANELNEEVADAIARLRAHDIVVLNQSVLLRGVNDSSHALVALSEKLFEIGVLPYYLHQLDPVAGAAHFAVEDDRAKSLISEVSANLSGFLVPKLVRESPDQPAKRII